MTPYDAYEYREKRGLAFYSNLRVACSALMRRLPGDGCGQYVSSDGKVQEFPVNALTVKAAEQELDVFRFLDITFNFNCFVEELLKKKGQKVPMPRMSGSCKAPTFFACMLAEHGVNVKGAIADLLADIEPMACMAERGWPPTDPIGEVVDCFQIRNCLVHRGASADQKLMECLTAYKHYVSLDRKIVVPYLILERINCLFVNLAAHIDRHS